MDTPLTFAFEAIGKISEQAALFPTTETGGFLVGEGSYCEQAWAALNEAADPAHGFSIGAPQMSLALSSIAQAGLETLGTYHSHPGGSAQLSEADALTARNTGLMLIVGMVEPEWDWRLWQPGVGELGFRIAPPGAGP